jgi:signal transduction histidine kinase
MNTPLYKQILNTLPHTLFVLDKELKVVLCNQSGEALLKKTTQQMLGQNLSEVIPHTMLQIQAEAVLKDGRTKSVEIHLNTFPPKVLKATITALIGAGPGRSNFCLITLEDISQHSYLEEQLVQSEKLAGMGLLAQSVAHELGNPLTIMSSTLQYIRDVLLRLKSPQLTEAVETIMDSLKQMDELLRSLSEFTSSQRPRFESTNLPRLLSQMLGFIYKEAETRNIQISHQFDDNLPDCSVNSREMRQMFLNLLKNAIEAMDDGGQLNVKMYLLKGKDEVCIEISDTGKGISEAEMRSIFRAFYSTKPGGTGLGLPFCRRVMDEHGGEIRVNSELGKGSTFSVILPIRQKEMEASDL